MNGTSKFKRLSHDTKIQREESIQSFLMSLKKKCFITTKSNDKIYPYSLKPGKMYGSLSSHKITSIDITSLSF